MDHSLPLLLLFSFCLLTPVFVKQPKDLFTKAKQQLGVVCFTYLLVSAAPTNVQFALPSCQSTGNFLLFVALFVDISLLFRGCLYGGGVDGKQCALWFLGLAIIICDRETAFSGSMEPYQSPNKRIDWYLLETVVCYKGNNQHLFASVHISNAIRANFLGN